MGEARATTSANHTLSHPELNNLSVEQIEQEIIGGEGAFVAALAQDAKRPRYFRFPENHTGNTQEKHDAIAAFLKSRGSIDNEDYAFNVAYLKMLARNDAASAARLRADHLLYTSTEIDYYAELHKQISAGKFRR